MAKQKTKQSEATQEPAPKNPVGRPGQYRPNLHPKLARQCGQLGLTKEEAAEAIEISVETFYLWEAEHPEFLQAFTQGKGNPISALKGRLFQLAHGFSHVVEKVLSDGTIVEYVEHVPPDFKALAYYLGNRDPKNWKNRHEVGFSDPDGNPTKLVIEIVDPKKDP